MTEHSQLKKICDKIWYKLEWFIFDNYADKFYSKWFLEFTGKRRYLNVREIIFTEDFIWKMNSYYLQYLYKKYEWKYTEQELVFWRIEQYLLWYFKHLDNPVEYLYNLIKE